MNQQILQCVYAAIDEVNGDRRDLPPLEKAPDTQLHGARGSLDSLGLVTLLVATEEGIERELGVTISISDDRALAMKPSPLESVDRLVAYIQELIREQRQ